MVQDGVTRRSEEEAVDLIKSGISRGVAIGKRVVAQLF